MTLKSERADVDKRLIDERPVESGHTSDGIEVIDVDALPSTDERQPADVQAKCTDVATDECRRDERPGDGKEEEVPGIKEGGGCGEGKATSIRPVSEIQPANELSNEPSSPRLPVVQQSSVDMSSYGAALANQLRRTRYPDARMVPILVGQSAICVAIGGIDGRAER